MKNSMVPVRRFRMADHTLSETHLDTVKMTIYAASREENWAASLSILMKPTASHPMRKLMVILFIAELIIAGLFGQLGFLHRRDFDRAFFAWHQNPTSQSKLELDRQRHLNELCRWEFSAVAFGTMAGLTLLAAYIYNRRRRPTSVVQR